jgi:hypothetical protein
MNVAYRDEGDVQQIIREASGGASPAGMTILCPLRPPDG